MQHCRARNWTPRYQFEPVTERLTLALHERQGAVAMNVANLTRLTDRQLECLRLVARNQDSFEIARILNIKPGTVDSHVKAAMAKLGTSSRFAAANALSVAEMRHQSLVIQPLVTDAAPAADQNDTLYVQEDAEPDHPSVQEVHAPFDAFGPVEEEAPASLPQGAIRNDLTARKRLMLTAVTIALMFLGAFAAAAMIYTVQGIIKSPNPITSH